MDKRQLLTFATACYHALFEMYNLTDEYEYFFSVLHSNVTHHVSAKQAADLKSCKSTFIKSDVCLLEEAITITKPVSLTLETIVPMDKRPPA